MGKKYKKYKNFVEKFLDSEKGKRFFQKAYGLGAAIVIFGAMAKVLHWSIGDLMFGIGMMTEVIVFILWSFEKPGKEYKWEEVYPVLAENDEFIPRAQRKTQEAAQQPATQQQVSGNAGPAIQSTTMPSSSGGVKVDSTAIATGQSGSGGYASGSGGVSGGTIVVGGGIPGGTASSGGGSSAGGSGLSGNITIVSGGGGGGTVSSGGGMSSSGNGNISSGGISGSYPEMPADMADSIDKFAKTVESLNQITDTLSKSFQIILNNSEGIGNNTQGYISQMESLNRNLAGLNTIYEVQLKGVSGQINTIEHINAGLERIKKLYDGSLADSSIFKTETEKMAQQLAELNRVYARLLEAMTTNMNIGGGFGMSSGQGGTTPPQP